MERDLKVLHGKRNLILATVGLFALNFVLSITLTNTAPDQVGVQTTSWKEIFIYARPFSILLYIVYLLSLFEKTDMIGKRILSFAMMHMDMIFLLVVFLYLALYELYVAYFSNLFISPDSSKYMREASSLLAGNGFYVDRLAGYDTWFATWPIGYPALLAAATFISGRSVYFSSKLLSILLVGAGLVVLRLRFKDDAWIFSLIYLNIGFLKIYGYTWSENPFILSLIIWGIGLAAIVEKARPEKRWYVIAALGISGAFLTRYFGIVTILFTGFCLLLYLLHYFTNKRDAFVLSKIRGLLCVEAASSAIVGFYLLMNRTMGRAMSGVDRTIWWDDYDTLISNLYDALTTEIFHATRIDVVSLMPDFYSQGKAAVIILFLTVLMIALVKNYEKEKKFDYKTVFIGAGVFYFIAFIAIRFYSSMDEFGFRFFTPAGMMISIGILGFIKDKFSDSLNKFQIVTCLFLIILCGGFVQKIKYYTIETSAYHVFYDQVTESVAEIPPKGAILNYDGEWQLAAFRPDIMLDGQIAYDDTMDTILAKYNGSSSFWIRKGVLSAIVNDKNYSEEVRTVFLQYEIEGINENEYIRIH